MLAVPLSSEYGTYKKSRPDVGLGGRWRGILLALVDEPDFAVVEEPFFFFFITLKPRVE